MAFIPCNIGGGESSTPITPSNSSPVALTANTPVNPTANGYAIASYSHITPSNSSPVTLSTNIYQSGGSGYAIRSYSSITPSSTPESVSSGDIVKIGGSGVIVDSVPTPTPLTPDNSSPATITSGTLYSATANGKAVASITNVTPSNSSPVALTSGDIDKMGGNGYAIESYTTLTNMQTNVSSGDMLRANEAGKVAMLQQLTPSNTSPPSIDYMGGYYAAPTSGYVISSYSSVTPSSTPTSVSAGNMVQIGGSGVIVDSIPTPTILSPSNSSPAAITNGGLYQASASGYAISSYSSKTPSDTSPASVSSGAIIKASSAGYLVKNTPVSIGVPDVISQANLSGNSSRTITVTKTPRAVVLIMVRNSDSTGRSYCWCYDVQNSKYEYFSYTSDGYSHTENTGALSVITVSSSSVTVTNNTAATCRTHALIYY